MFISKSKKKLFEEGKTAEYRYLDEIFCRSEEAYDETVKKYSNNSDYWSEQETYTVKKYFPKTYSEIKNVLIDSFFELFDEKPVLMDIGCAGGEWTLTFSEKCKEIDGYEYSGKMVKSANAEASKRGITNVKFYQADASEMKLDKVYDSAMVLGMFIYIRQDDVASKIIQNVYDHLKPGAYICTRDTMNDENIGKILMFNKSNGYTAFYRSRDEYYRLFKEAGFELHQEFILNELNSRRMKFLHVGNIWKKPE